MNDSWSWAYNFKCYEKLRMVDDVEDSWSWAQDFICLEQLTVMVDKNESQSWAQGSRCYEQLKVVGDMSNFGSWVMTLDAMKNSRHCKIWKNRDPLSSDLYHLPYQVLAQVSWRSFKLTKNIEIINGSHFLFINGWNNKTTNSCIWGLTWQP